MGLHNFFYSLFFSAWAVAHDNIVCCKRDRVLPFRFGIFQLLGFRGVTGSGHKLQIESRLTQVLFPWYRLWWLGFRKDIAFAWFSFNYFLVWLDLDTGFGPNFEQSLWVCEDANLLLLLLSWLVCGVFEFDFRPVKFLWTACHQPQVCGVLVRAFFR